MNAVTLPQPDPDALQHSARLQAMIHDEIAAAGGAISFARFMALALYAPGLGYYSAGAHKLGAAGDFVTAPELSPLFGQCLARQCREVLQRLGGGDILEFGAGSGALAAEVLLTLEALDCLPRTYAILDLSADLRARQRETLSARAPHLLSRVKWLDQLPETGFRGVVLANEVLDAMPVHLLRYAGAGFEELRVICEGEGLGWRGEPIRDGTLAAHAQALEKELGDGVFCPGYTTEINLAAEGWVNGVASFLEAGLCLIIDYGFPRREYYHPDRRDGTLMCHYRHHAHDDPLALVGLQDITAHVDFTAVAEQALAAGLEVAGYTSQAHFLLGCGLGALLAGADPSDTRRYLTLTQQVKKLTLPQEMGELFKVLALRRGLEGPLMGFSIQDRRSALG